MVAAPVFGIGAIARGHDQRVKVSFNNGIAPQSSRQWQGEP